MDTKTALKVLTDYFNIKVGRRPIREWAMEVRELKAALTPEEYATFVAAVAEVTGDTVGAE